MPIGQVLLSNTFNEFRVTVNEISNTVNDLTANTLTGDIVANTITVGQVSSNLIPSANVTYDLGSATNRWNDLYLSGNTIFLGGSEISFDGAKITFGVSGSNILDTSNLNASNLNSGTIPDARFPATLPTANGVNLTFLNAANLATGTLPDARFPSTLPTANGVNLTFLNATNLGTGTLPDARFPATLPTANGVNLTFLNATNLGTGTVPNARTTAASANGASTIVARDAAGNFTVNAVTGTSVLVSDGSAGTPSIRFSDDTNTGIFRDGADNLVFSTGGVARANVNSSGYFEAVFKDKVVALGNSGTAQTLDLRTGNIFTTTLTGNCTFTISNPQIGSSFILQITNDGTAGRSVSFTPGTFRYPFGSIGRSTGANAIDIWYFTTFDGGTNWIVALPIKSAATA